MVIHSPEGASACRLGLCKSALARLVICNPPPSFLLQCGTPSPFRLMDWCSCGAVLQPSTTPSSEAKA